MSGAMTPADLLPAVRDLFGAHPRARYASPEVIAGLLWILCYVPEPVAGFEVEEALEPLDIEREEAA